MATGKYSKKKVLAAIADSAGIKSTIAKRLGCGWKTADNLIARWPETQEAYNDENEKVLDMSETTVLSAIKKGDVTTAKWLLSNKAKKRGYGETNVPTDSPVEAFREIIAALGGVGAMPAPQSAPEPEQTANAESAQD